MAGFGNLRRCGFTLTQHCFQRLKRLKGHADFLETYSPTIKSSGFFYFDSVGLARPEITHYKNRLLNRFTPPANAKTLLLLPQTRNKPFHKAPEMKKIRQLLRILGPELADKVHVAVFCAPFGVVPLELDEVYPLSQHEAALPLDRETVAYVAGLTADYIKQMPYSSVTMLNDPKLWKDHVEIAVQKCLHRKRQSSFDAVEANDWGRQQTTHRQPGSGTAKTVKQLTTSLFSLPNFGNTAFLVTTNNS